LYESTSIVSYLYYLMRSLNGSAILLPGFSELLSFQVSTLSNESQGHPLALDPAIQWSVFAEE
jgi:hypothetical protein